MSSNCTSAESQCLQECGLEPSKLVTSEVLTTDQYSISIVQYQPTNRPIEDRYSITHDEEHKRLVVGVYDGHGGSATSSYISTIIPDLLLRSPPSPENHALVFEDLDAKMLEAFTKDHSSSFFRSKSKEWKENAEIVKSGSTALVLDLNLEDGKPVVSNAGDCRLVVCRRPLPTNGGEDREPSGRSEGGTVGWETTDLTARLPAEQERLSSEHPGEDMIIVGGRLFGKLAITRGFGDAHFKLPRANHRKYISIFSSIEHPSKVPLNQQYESYFYGYKTPPYITSRPESSVVDLERGGDTIVLASDGFWDIISSEDVARNVYGRGEENSNVALDILCKAAENKRPGDDVTIVVLKLLTPSFP